MENKKNLWIILGVVAVVIVIIVVAALQSRKAAAPVTETPTTGTPTTEPAEETPAAEDNLPKIEALKDARVEVPGANPITKDNKVVNLEGQVTKNDVAMTSPLAPSETPAISKEALPETAISLDVTAAGFSPKEFTVKPGQPVTLAITAVDSIHNLVFEDASLSAVGMGAYKGQTRAITFNAPTKAGEYVFYCNVGGVVHKNRGEVGKMIVK